MLVCFAKLNPSTFDASFSICFSAFWTLELEGILGTNEIKQLRIQQDEAEITVRMVRKDVQKGYAAVCQLAYRP